MTSAEDGEPLVGATVTPIGGGLATATDIDGAFRLQVPASVKKLSVTYVGMQSKEVNIDFNAPMHIELTTNQTALDEVMVVAFGTSKKQAFTAARRKSESPKNNAVTAPTYWVTAPTPKAPAQALKHTKR